MSDRRVKVVFEAEVGGLKKGLAEAATATEKLAKSTETAGKSIDERMQKINVVAAADQKAAKAAGLLYNAQGQLADSNGRVLSSTQAAAHGVEAFSEAVYLSGHEAGVAAAATEAAAKKAADAAEKQKAAWQTVAPVMMAAGAGMVAGVGLAVKKYADFDKAMSSVDAATHETAGNMGLLREAAMTAGADTAFSAEEAAKGIEELAKAGVSTEAILSGGLDGALALAAAGELAVGDAAEIAATQMVVFGLEGKDLGHVADLLAAGAGKAQGSVKDLAMGLKYVGPVAAGMSVSIEETTGALAMFASEGIVGEQAGTSLRGMLGALTAPSKLARKEIDALGITLYDGNGKFLGLANAAEQLKGAYTSMDDAQRDASLGAIFGNETITAARVLYKQGAEGVNEWTDAVNDSGFAADTAARMQNNLAGDLELLGGAFDTVFLKAGGTGNDALRGFVQAAEGVVDAIGKIPAPVMGVGAIMAGVAGGALLIGGGLITAIPKIKDTVDALKDIAPAGSKADKSLRGVGKAAAYTAGAVGALSIVGPTIASWVSDGLSADPSKLAAELRNIGAGGKDAEVGLAGIEAIFNTGGKDFFSGLDVGGLEDAFRIMGNPNVSDNVDNTLSSILSFGTRGSSNIEFAKKNFSELDTQLSSMVSNGMADQAGVAYEALAQKALDAGVPIEKLVEIFPGYNSALAQNSTAAAAAVGANEETASALEEVGLAADGAIESMDKFLESLFALGNVNMSAREAAAAYQEALEGVTEAQKEIAKGKMGKTLNKTKDDFNLTTEAGKLAQAEFHGLAKGGMAEVEAMAAQGLGQDELQGKLNTTYKDLVKAGEGFGLSGKAAQELAREVLGVPDGVDIKTWMDSEAKRVADETTGALEAIPGYVSVAVAVSEDGTVGEVQGKIDSVTGKTEYVFVTDDGTVVNVQQKIENVNGVERTVYVGDDGTVYTTQGKINSVTDGAAKVNVTDGGTINSVQQGIYNLKGGSVTVKVGYNDPGTPIGFSSLIPKRASGGSVFGQGTETSDSIPAWLSNNEHVLSAKEVRGLGGHSAVERLRAMARGGDAPRFATGGAVGRAESKVKSTRRAYDLIDGKRTNRLRKLAAKDQWEAAKAELAAVKKSSKASADAAKEAKERAGRLNESRRDLRTDLRRGNITDAFTSGSGMGQVDKLLDASRNKDYSASKRRGLARDGNAFEKTLTILTKKSEGLKTAIDAATSSADELRSVRDAVAGDLRGEFSLSGMLGETRKDLGSNPFTARGIAGKANAMAKRIEIFAGRLNRLRKLGYGETIIQEVAGLGTEDGITVAGVLMNATKGERNSIVGAYKGLDTASGKAGQYVTESMYKGGLDAAEGLVKGLESQSKNVDAAFYKLGKNAEKAFKRSLGIKSPSRVMFGAGVNVGEGAELGILSKVGDVSGAAEKLMAMPALSVPPSAEVARYAAQPAGAGFHMDYALLAQEVVKAAAAAQPVNFQMDGRTLVKAVRGAEQQYVHRK